MNLLSLAAITAALASPVRDAGRERPAAAQKDAPRYTEFVLTAGSYIGSKGGASARPDGSGGARSRTQLYLRDHSDGDQLHFIADGILLSDTARIYKPTSLDYYLGLRKQSSEGRFLGVGREETLPLDRKGFSSRAWELRAGTAWTAVGAAGAYAGWFFKNDGRPVRPDQSGEAYLRYALFLHTARGPLAFRLDGDFLTDKGRKKYRPAALDLSVAAAVNWTQFEVSLAYKPWITLDRKGVAESWLLGFTYQFDGRNIWSAVPGTNY
ncbi:MAG: hypothetical protein HY925_12910 [Elusimicrobia bacterium]|nr:hypothetical protein [Elusimicrobiota bacterium]